MIGIRIDTGGTCTDAVIYDFETNEILGAGKALTTKSNLEIGIANALDTLPAELVKKAGAIGLSTTLATNACVEDKGARAKLLMIGFDESMMEHLKEIYASYGLKDIFGAGPGSISETAIPSESSRSIRGPMADGLN